MGYTVPMNRIVRFVVSLSLFFISFLFLGSQSAFAEKITDFQSVIHINKNDSVMIEETIAYDSEGLVKHGIYRYIPLSTIENNPVHEHSIKVHSVTDDTGKDIPYDSNESYQNGVSIKVLKIGDPNNTFAGQKTYHIRYTFSHALSQDKDGSAYLYFNITGNGWPFAIEKTEFSIVSDGQGPTLEVEKMKCFFGDFGTNSDSACNLTDEQKDSKKYSAQFTNSLFPGQGVTVLLPLDYMTSPFPAKWLSFLMNYGLPIFMALLSLSVIIMCLYLYKKYGKDPDDGRIVMAEYDAPEGVTPLESSFILNEKITPTAISAEIVEMARAGFLTIEAKEEKGFFFGLGKNTSFSLRVISVPLVESSKKLLTALSRIDIFIKNASGSFGVLSAESLTERTSNISKALEDIVEKDAEPEKGKLILLSKSVITNEELEKIRKSVESSLLEKKLFDRITSNEFSLTKVFKTKSSILILLFFVFAFLVGFACLFIGSFLYAFTYFPIFVISVVALLRSLNRKTLEGVDIKYKLLGLKKYIEVVEERRIDFHNVPAKTPTLFIKLLPWAIFFGLEKKWSKEFESIQMTQEDVSFYHSSFPFVGSSFVSSFGESMENFSTVASQAATVASSSGSGSGGSSGGGGGGGGGGSW